MNYTGASMLTMKWAKTYLSCDCLVNSESGVGIAKAGRICANMATALKREFHIIANSDTRSSLIS